MSRSARLFFAFWVILAGSAGAPNPCFADTPITLRDTTEVRGMIVRLSDVFTGIPVDIDEPIAQAPAPGKQVTYDVSVLNRLADKYQLDWKPKSIADHIVITTASSRITKDMLHDAVVAKLKEIRDADGTHAHGGIEVMFDTRTSEVDLPTDHVPSYALNNFDYNPETKRFNADLVAQVPGGPTSFPVAGRVTFMRTIPVLARQLEGGTIISATDLDTTDIPEDRVNESVISDAHELIGHELRRDTESGEVLHTRDIIPPRCVVRGGIVILKIQTPFMLLTAQGKAMQDGAQGDVVRVTNTQSNRVVEGVVEGPGVVRIQTAQKLAEAQ
jgi:flagella basal body P-ring formation protein FlgA